MKYVLALKVGASASRLSKQGVNVYKVKSELFDLGLSEAESPTGLKSLSVIFLKGVALGLRKL